MRLQGYSPAGSPVVSYLNSPSGSIIGSAQRPVGRVISLPGLPGNPGVPGEVTNAQLTVALSTKADTSYVDSLASSLSALGPMITNKQPKTLTGTCSIAAGTAAKTVTLDSPWATYTPVAGDRLQLVFTSGNTATDLTLSVNGAAANPITNSYNISNSAQLRVGAGFPLYMDFDGTRWIANPTYNDSYKEIYSADVINNAGTATGLISGRRAEDLLVNEATKARTYTNKTISGSNNTITGPITDTNDPANANTLARKAYVDAQISALVASSPSTLDTLQELATALGNDPNFATTVTNLIASKQAKFMTGTVATAASTAAKTVTLDAPWASYTPAAGDWFYITFTNGNSVASPTLAINGSTARSIATSNGQTSSSNVSPMAGYGLLLYFDGTRLIMTGAAKNTTYYATYGWTTITGTTQSASNGNSYLANNASRVTITLPSTAAVGDCIAVQGLGAGGWKVQAPASNNIIYEGTSSATAGYIASTNQYDAVLLFCVVANTTWLVVNYSGVISVDGTAVYPTGLATKTYVDAIGPIVAAKVDKVATASSIYGTDGSGNQSSYAWAVGAAADSFARRTATGALQVATPTASDHATTKGYVDALRKATANAQTASYTLALADAYGAVEMDVASANNLTVPPNSTVAFEIGTVIEIGQLGAGQTTIVAGSGVTIRSAGGKLKLTGQYSTASLRKRATDEWWLVGDITT